jgi:hypothetical protein
MSDLKQVNNVRFKLGDFYLKKNNLARAIEVFWEILDEEPNNRKGIRMLKTARKRESNLTIKTICL